MVAEQPTMFDDDAQHDETVRFYAEWHGVRYSFGSCTRKPVKGVKPKHLTKEMMQSRSMPFGRVMFEVEFQPMLYRHEDDDPEMPMREQLFVKARQIPESDYIVLTDEKLKEIKEEQ